jgi:hypothetical protein
MRLREILKIIDRFPFSKARNFLCGEKIGSGLYRDVYELRHNPRYVVKIDVTTQFANITEWRYYIDNKDWKLLGSWLAPCEMISKCGRILIQRRVRHGEKEDYPKKIPAVFIDTKLQNFGWIGDKFVCCDYAYMPLCTEKGLKRARWWSVETEK